MQYVVRGCLFNRLVHQLKFHLTFSRDLYTRYSPKVHAIFVASGSQLGFIIISFLSEHLRVGCDYLNFVFVYDEYADGLVKDDAQKQANIVMDALRNPSKVRPEGESLIGEMARQSVAPFLFCGSFKCNIRLSL